MEERKKQEGSKTGLGSPGGRYMRRPVKYRLAVSQSGPAATASLGPTRVMTV